VEDQDQAWREGGVGDAKERGDLEKNEGEEVIRCADDSDSDELNGDDGVWVCGVDG
jgi:hypothetical protein